MKFNPLAHLSDLVLKAMKKYIFTIAIIFLLIVSNVDVFGQNQRRTRTISKPQTQIFLEGGNDSWNTRQKPGSKRKAVKKVKSSRTSNSLTTNQRRTKPVRNLQTENGGLDTTPEEPPFGDAQRRTNSAPEGQQTNILPYIEQQNIKKKAVVNGAGGSGNRRQSGSRARKKYANQETGYRKKRKRF
jgi:hypothetical protein